MNTLCLRLRATLPWLFVLPLYASAAEPVDFVRDVQPILAAKCESCHGADEQEGQLRLDARASVFKGGVSGPTLVKGTSNKSLIVERITTNDLDVRMPLEDDPLTEKEVAIIRAWIDSGAPWPDGVGAQVEIGETHWAYRAPVQAAPPTVQKAGWVQTPIDAFIMAKLETARVSPSPRADDARLLRRVYLDLIGVPPTVEQVEAFLGDTGPDKYYRVVDRLLASPQYGARWARPWLDAARYADSNGYQADQYRNVWPYRDWVINAMNADMPFDRFTRDQIAGDLLPDATIDQKIATGFHRLTTCNVEAGVDPEENRVNQVIDRVNTTGTVWLGTTLECAQCHNHKYDPFSQRDYYQLFAYFNSTPLEVEGNGVTYNFYGPKLELPLTAEQQREVATLKSQLSTLEQQLSARTTALAEKQPDWEASLRETAKAAPEWHELEIESFTSEGGASHTILSDQSVLVGGVKPDTDVYTVVSRTELTAITGFKVEALTDPSLPGMGPGRHHPERPNFVLHEFTVTAAACEDTAEPTPISLHHARADYSQPQYQVAGAIDGNATTGWAIHPKFHQPHQATFLTTNSIGFEAGTKLTFVLDQHHGQGRTIGRLRLSAMTGQPADDSIPENIAKLLKTPADKRTKKQAKTVRDYYVGLDADVKQQTAEVDRLKKQVAAIQPITTLVMVKADEDRMNAVFRRGNFKNKAGEVSLGTPRALHRLADDSPGDRRALAGWLTSRDNPLTARVSVNRWWAEIFGRGLVETIEDFGTQGERPTHPELLDWLAVEFMESGWSMKHIHRLIVTSAVYQQSSRLTPEQRQREPYNRLFARGSRFRLSAESIRDNALAIAGLVSFDMGGPPIYPPQPDGVWRHVGRNAPKYETSQGNDRFRRGIYVVWRRSAPYASFVNFDAPDRASCVVKRPRTNTPLQALTLLNDPAYIEIAVALAERIARAPGATTTEDRVAYAIRRCVAREPRSEEIHLLADVYRNERQRFQDDPTGAAKLVGKRDDAEDLAAWFYVANILLNLDETITKG